MRFISSIVLFIFIIAEFGFSKELYDNLVLRGIVIDIKDNKAIVDVKSLSCKGKREFKIDNISTLEKGENIKFIINSSKCEKDKVYDIIEVLKNEIIK